MPPEPKIFFKLFDDFVKNPTQFDLSDSKYRSLNLRGEIVPEIRRVITRAFRSSPWNIPPLDFILNEYSPNFRYRNAESPHISPTIMMWILQGNDASWAMGGDEKMHDLAFQTVAVEILLEKIDTAKDEIRALESSRQEVQSGIKKWIQDPMLGRKIDSAKKHLVLLYSIKRRIEKGEIAPKSRHAIEELEKRGF